MYRFEIAWHENDGTKFGRTKYKGFTQRDRFESFLKKLHKKENVRILKVIDATVPSRAAS